MPSEAEKAWIEAWRYAAPRLEELRRRELRDMDEHEGLRLMGARDSSDDKAPSSGLIEFQRWMKLLRQRLEATDESSA